LLFCLAYFIAGVGHASEHYGGTGWWAQCFSRFLTVGAATLPAFGAAICGIRSHGEFARLTKRSHAMWTKLEEIEHSLPQVSTDLSSTTLG